MISMNFYRDRECLDNEFLFPNFDPSTGLDPSKLKRELQNIFNEKYETVPMPTLRAEMFAYLYDHVQIEINPKNIFASKINHDKALVGFTDIARERTLQKFSPDTQELKILTYEWGCRPLIDFHHTLPNWHDIHKLGFPGLLARAEERKIELQKDPSATKEQLIFIDSVITVYSALMRLLCRIRDESIKYPEAAPFTACIGELILHEPRTLYEAMLLTDLFMNFYEVGIENSRSFGLIDRLYEPLYLADLEERRCTEEEAREMFRYFLNKYSAANRNAGQPFGLGGADKDGNYGSIRLTKLILEVYRELGIINPKIHVRYHANMPDELLKQILEMIRHGTSSINLTNDEIVWRGYEKIGINREISQHYLPQGCFEPTIMGLEEPLICCSWISIPKAIEFAMTGGVDMLTGKASGVPFDKEPATYEEFYQRFLTQLDGIINNVIRVIDGESDYMHMINPSPLYSGTFGCCIDKAADIYNRGAVYSNTSVKLCGIGTTVDSLMIVKKYVYDEKLISLREFAELLRHNWEGREKMRLEILKETNRYGNGLDEPDNTAKDIYEHAAALIVGRKNRIGGLYRLGADSVMHCMDHAVNVGATPDGRLASAPFSRNMCSVAGMEREGITASMLSVLKIDATNLINAAVCDLIIHPSAVEGERGLDAFMALTKVYFELGGMVLQGNVFCLDDLYAAQKNPEKYANLQVRVCGWNEFFVKMTEAKQNEFIKRCQKTL